MVWGGRTMVSWQIRDYDVLFGDHPPTEPTAPTAQQCDRLGLTLGRSRGAALSQWGDARSVVLGNRSAASQPLCDYLRNRGWA